jgi:tetratricopeptide (TPR) repeat protein
MHSRLRPLFVALLAASTLASGCDRGDPGRPERATESPGAALVKRSLAKFRSGARAPREANDPRLQRIVLRIKVDDIAGAIQECDAILGQEPGNVHARYFKAFSNHRSKLYAAARPDFESVLAAGPAFPKAEGAFLYYAWCCYYLGDLDTAAAAFDAVAELRVDPGDAKYGLALIALENGELERAEVLLRESWTSFEGVLAEKGSRATDSDRKNVAKAKVRLGAVLLQRSEIEPETATTRLAEARGLVEDAVRIVSKIEEAWFTLSRIYARLGEKELEQHALETMKKGRESARSSTDSEPR